MRQLFDCQRPQGSIEVDSVATFGMLSRQSTHERTFPYGRKSYEPNTGDSCSRNIESSWIQIRILPAVSIDLGISYSLRRPRLSLVSRALA